MEEQSSVRIQFSLVCLDSFFSRTLFLSTSPSLAAHCIIDQPKYIKVVAGASNLFGRLNLFNYYSVSRVIIDPNYVSCCDHDLAIIKLEKNLERSQMINSICLPQEENLQLQPDSMAFVAGWGGKYPNSELNAFGSFNLKQGLVYIKEKSILSTNLWFI